MGAREPSERTIAADATMGFASGGVGYGPIMGQQWPHAERLRQSESGRKTLVAPGIAAEFILPAIGTNDLFSQKSRRAQIPIGEFSQKRYELGFACASFARTFLQAC